MPAEQSTSTQIQESRASGMEAAIIASCTRVSLKQFFKLSAEDQEEALIDVLDIFQMYKN